MTFFWCCGADAGKDCEQMQHLQAEVASANDEYASAQTAAAQQRGGPAPTLLAQPMGNVDPVFAKKIVVESAGEAGKPLDSYEQRVGRGFVCQKIMEGNGERVEAMYRVDRQRLRFFVSSGTGPGSADVAFPISAIEDIYQIADGEDCFTHEVISSLTAEERERLFLIVYAEDPVEDPRSVCLLERSQQGRDSLLDYLQAISSEQVPEAQAGA